MANSIQTHLPLAALDFNVERHPNPKVSVLIGEVEWRLKMSDSLKASAAVLDAHIETLREAIKAELSPKE